MRRPPRASDTALAMAVATGVLLLSSMPLLWKGTGPPAGYRRLCRHRRQAAPPPVAAARDDWAGSQLNVGYSEFVEQALVHYFDHLGLFYEGPRPAGWMPAGTAEPG